MQIANLRCEYLVNPLGLDVPRPRFCWNYVHSDPVVPGERQTAYRILVASDPRALERDQGDLWDSGKVESDRTTQIPYEGRPLTSFERCYWKIISWDNQGRQMDSSQEGEVGFWETGIMTPEDWQAAWIGPKEEAFQKIQVVDTTKPDKEIEILQSPPCPLIRSEFRLKPGVKSATLLATALGEYEVRLNGERVGDRYLTPEWTDYNERLLYQAYDVSSLLKDGQNAIGAMIGDGWYMGLLGPGDAVRQHFYGKVRRFFCQLHVEYTDGTRENICTSKEWKMYLDGPILNSDHFLGELYDARKEQEEWDSVGFDDAGWIPVFVDETVSVNLVGQKHQPIQVFQEIKPVEVTEPEPGTYIFNLGQNMVGWCAITLEGTRGQQIQLRHGEMLELNGTLHTENLRLAAQTDIYILDGTEPRTFHPHFTFHGFQYVEVTGLTEKPSLDFLMGHAYSSNPPVTGYFECSNPMLNQLWRNILWTQRDNMHSIPTDCPQRNERMGWMGDAQVFAQTAIYNMDMAAFFAKFTVDMRDGQGEDGYYPDFAPHPFQNHWPMCFGPGWADCGIIVPWRLYVAYGDTRVLEEHYASMQAYLALIQDENPNGLWTTWGSNYGDWLHGDTLKAEGYPKEGGEMPKEVYATTFYYLSATLMSKIAKILGKDDDARTYSDLAARIKEAFNAEFVDPTTGKIKGDTQSDYAIALGFDLLLSEIQDLALQNLMAALAKYEGRISTGFISTIQMIQELSARGQNEQAYKLVESERFPSWGYQIAQGATTIWERWDGYVKGRGFQDRGMNSFNHYSIGAVGEWLYSVVLGIQFDPSVPAMKHLIIQPRPGGTLIHAKGHYDSLHGRIEVEWRREADAFRLKVNIPPNTSATVHLPEGRVASTHLNGKPLETTGDIEVLTSDQSPVVIKVPSGRYEFVTMGEN